MEIFIDNIKYNLLEVKYQDLFQSKKKQFTFFLNNEQECIKLFDYLKNKKNQIIDIYYLNQKYNFNVNYVFNLDKNIITIIDQGE